MEHNKISPSRDLIEARTQGHFQFMLDIFQGAPSSHCCLVGLGESQRGCCSEAKIPDAGKILVAWPEQIVEEALAMEASFPNTRCFAGASDDSP